jgi:hypothetical protein
LPEIQKCRKADYFLGFISIAAGMVAVACELAVWGRSPDGIEGEGDSRQEEAA